MSVRTHFKPIHYRRYVDDTFLLFRSPDHVLPFLNYLNTRHPNIQFTCDTEKDGMLPFLDVNIKRDDIFKTSVYRKPTFTGLFTNFHSFLPLLYKINLAKCLFTRAFRICSSHAVADKEFKNIVALLLKNSFPQSLLDKCLRSILDKVYSPVPVRQTVERKQLLLVLPFTGQHGIIIRTKLMRLYKRFFPMANLRIVFVPSLKLRNFFRFKDTIPQSMQSLVVYEYSCTGCNARYVGQTARHLKDQDCRTLWDISKNRNTCDDSTL